MAAVAAPLEIRVRRPDRVGTNRIDEDLLVVARVAAAVRALRAAAAPAASSGRTRRTGAARRTGARRTRARRTRGRRGRRRRRSRRRSARLAVRRAHALEIRARVIRSEEPGFARQSVDQRVHARRLGFRIDAERDTADVARRQALGELRPRPAAVRRLEESAFRSAADHLADGAPALPHRRVEHVGVVRIDHDLVGARVRAHGQHGLPRPAAVRRLVDAAVAAGGPQRSLHRDVDDVGVARIDLDVADVLGRLEADARERLAAVGRLVEAVAIRRAARVRVLAGAEPDDVRVLRIDDDAAQVEGAAVVEHRSPRVAAVVAFPQPADG